MFKNRKSRANLGSTFLLNSTFWGIVQKYFEYLKNNDNIGLAKWFKELSKNEEERIKKFK